MDYKKFITGLKKHLDSIDRVTQDDADRLAILDGVWTIGQEVNQYARSTGKTAKDIALDIGAAPGSLQKYVRIYNFYPQGYKSEINGKPISWSHYAAVLYIADKVKRNYYLKETAEQGWSSRELRRRIRNNYYENRLSEGTRQNTKTRKKLRTIEQNLYTYGAEVLKVIDGDTLTLEIDMGFKTKSEHKARLRGINCPERKTKKGEVARKFVIDELFGKASNTNSRTPAANSRHPVVVIRTYKTGKFGRYIVDVWYMKGETKKERIFTYGRLLNQVLLDEGLAMKME